MTDVFDLISQQTNNTGQWSADDTGATLAALAAQNQADQQNRQQSYADSVAAAAQGFTPSSGGGNTAHYTSAQLGNPYDPNWAGNHLTRIQTPEGSVTVNKLAGKAFKGFLTALAARGYDAKSVQGYNLRTKNNGTGTKELSNHAYGMAIDIDPGSNPQVFGKKAKHSLPSWVGTLANKYGILWGGDWNSQKDYMHFEYDMGSVNNALARTKASKSSSPPSKAPSTKSPPAVKVPPHGAYMGGI